MDNHCPVIKKKIKEKNSPWLDEELRDLRRKRRKAEETKIKDKTKENKDNYKRLKDEFNKMAAIKRCIYNRKSLKNSSGDIKTLYNKLNRLLGNATSDLPNIRMKPSWLRALKTSLETRSRRLGTISMKK